MSPVPESDGLTMKRSYSAQGLAFQGVSLVCAACALLLSFALSFKPVICRGSPCLLWAAFGFSPEYGKF